MKMIEVSALSEYFRNPAWENKANNAHVKFIKPSGLLAKISKQENYMKEKKNSPGSAAVVLLLVLVFFFPVVVFTILKLAGIGDFTTWSWSWVLSPLVLAVVIFGFPVLASFCVFLKERTDENWTWV